MANNATGSSLRNQTSSTGATTQGSSSGSLTPKVEPYTAIHTPKRMKKAIVSNNASSQKVIMETGVASVLNAPTAEEFRALKNLLVIAAKRYVEWKIAEMGMSKEERADNKDKRKQKKTSKDKTQAGSEVEEKNEAEKARDRLERQWKELMSDKQNKRLMDRYKQANPDESASFKANEGISNTIWQELQRQWADRVKRGAERNEDWYVGSTRLSSVYDKVVQVFMRGWRPRLVSPSKRDSWAAEEKSKKTPPSGSSGMAWETAPGTNTPDTGRRS